MTINRQIIHLAVPSIISNITVPLLGLVDLAIVGHLGNAFYIAAIAVGSMIFNVIYWIFGFLRMGTSGMTSQALGSRDMEELMRLLIRSLSIGLLIAFCFLVFQLPLRWIALQIMRPSADVLPLVYTYYNICIWGAPAMLCLFGLTGWFIGMQNTRIPMVVAILQNVINIIVSLSLVFGVGMKIEGVAMGTLIAQWSGFLLALLLWLRYYGKISRNHSWKSGLFSQKAMVRFFKVNRDIFLRTLFLVSVNLFFTSFGARQGDLILSVNTLLMTFFTITSFVMDGFAFAGEALSGKYYGAGNREAFHEVMQKLFRWGFTLAIVLTLFFCLGGRGFLSILTDNKAVIDAAMPYLSWAVAVPIVGVGAFIYDGIFIGITATRGMLISSALSAVLFFLIYELLFGIMGNHALWLALVVYLAMRGIIQKIYMTQVHLI
ncbi:MAG: MATE family efflux transporter [Prevotella sp.]|nr:MATE family efflux transporter [Prevotella sp.]MCI1281035.1 MATE family efflux transporter [Prevotella sp.]